ncbi:MAG: diaminopimelate epimerase [Acidobacteria bacterium]|nr:diaminopimelate epimerase [Acidobacteriota bacterium]
MGFSRPPYSVTRPAPIPYAKGDAHGNDFLLVSAGALGRASTDASGGTSGGAPSRTSDKGLADLARAMCDRRTGIGADGLIVWQPTPGGASMKLRNADGSPAEVSGNGVRCLAALLVELGASGLAGGKAGGEPAGGEPITIDTAGGARLLELLDAAPPRYTFRAHMGVPGGLTEETLTVAGEPVRAVILSVGNPQCVILLPSLAEAERRLAKLGPALGAHERFPEGTNVELAVVERPDRVRIVIWERGVGPTAASGTGACASAVAAARYGGAARSVEVVSPGGSQRVEWTAAGIYLTGWAQLVERGQWTGGGREVDRVNGPGA